MQIGTLNIDVSEKVKDFVQYLDSTDRIILSARFGDGKTHLLNALRNDETANKEYEFFTIYPVNYSVAPNEDVFEYIKRDIIVQLNERGLLNNIDLEAIFDSLINFEDVASVISFLLSLLPGGPLYDNAFKIFRKIRKNYKKKKRTADKYLSTFANQKGCIYEEDGYTKLIREAIKWMGEDHYTGGHKWKGKKPVLIIEDLDRLDPKHLFRILNVISAHMEDSNTPDKVGNKFGFNNIILVMDYDATKHIFHHFYGDGACYEGYMSKFLSREPFRYSIQQEMVKEIEEKLASILKVPNLFSAFKTFRKKLSQSSIRDLSKLSQLDPKDFIKSPDHVISLSNSTVKTLSISTSFQLFQLIIYMVEAGMTQKQIKDDFIDIESFGITQRGCYLEEYLKMIYPIHITSNPYSEYIDIDNHIYCLRRKDMSKDPTEIEVVRMAGVRTTHEIPTLTIGEIGQNLFKCLKQVSSSINLSALHSGNN